MILHLTLHRRWFEEIASGRKREEYRDMTPHWRARFDPLFDLLFWPESQIHFRNGYNASSPFMRVAWVGIARGSWERRRVYVLKLGAILELKNYTPPVR